MCAVHHGSRCTGRSNEEEYNVENELPTAICRNCDQPIEQRLLDGLWLHTDDRGSRYYCAPPPKTVAEPEGMSDHD